MNFKRKVWKSGGYGILCILLALVLLGAGMLFPDTEVQAASRFWSKVNGVCYNGNGKKIPGAITRGIDISAWQGTIDWNKVKKADLDFVFVRVAHGTHVRDVQYTRNMSGAIGAGIPVGVYFYSEALTTAQSVKDAQWVIRQLDGYKISYPVVVDMESSKQSGLTNTQRSNIAKAFMDEVKKAGYYPMVYCNTYWYGSQLNTSILAGYDKWIANYGDALTKPNVAESVYSIWQATSGSVESGLKSTVGLIPGIPTGNSVDVNFGYKDYTKLITPRTHAKDSYVEGNQWVQDAVGWKYQLSDGSFVAGRSYIVDGKRYYFKSSGYMATGWYHHTNGKWYYFGSDGEMRTGLQKIGGKCYYFGTNGIMRTGLVRSNGNTFIFNVDGERLSGWQKYQNKWYYLKKNGAAQKSWLTLNGATYYFRQNGQMITGLNRIGGKKYYFDSNGRLKKGWFKYKNGKWYYADRKGVILENGWIQVSGTWYYLNPTGSMRTGWLTYKGDRYYLTSSGAMKIGWLKYKGKYYYFTGSGKMVRNQTLKIGGKNYTFNASGVRVA